MKVNKFNPFHVNRVGMNGPSFPLSIAIQHRDTVWTATGTALRAEDVTSILASVGGPFSLIFNVGQAVWFDANRSLIPSREIAKAKGVEADVHDIEWARPSPGWVPADLLVVTSSDLERFFEDWNVYNVDVVDQPVRPTKEALEETVLTVNTFKSGDPPVLSALERASTYFSGHDDCYFYVESRTDRVPQMLLCRLLALLAGSAFLGDQLSVDIPEPSLDIATELLSRSDRWAGLATLHPSGDVLVDLSPAAWRLDQPIPHNPTISVVLDASSGAWSVVPEAYSSPG